jgi:hypothetical protein
MTKPGHYAQTPEAGVNEAIFLQLFSMSVNTPTRQSARLSEIRIL